MMYRMILALLALLVSGCACHVPRFAPGGRLPTSLDQDKRHPLVSIVADEYVAVGPDPLYFQFPVDVGAVVWELPVDLKVRFADDNAIQFQKAKGFDSPPEGEFECRKLNDKQFQCINHNTRNGTYKYKITIRNSQDREKSVDPSFANGGH